MKSTGGRVTIASFSENDQGAVTLTVNVLAQFNLTLFERSVFGVGLEDLTPCDPRSVDEATDAMKSG